MKELNRFRQFLTEGDKDHKHTYKQIDPDGTAECTKCGLRNSDPSKTGEKVVKEDFKNPILDKYLELKKSIDYKTVFPTDLQSFVDSLDNTEREGLENDLAEGVIKEDYKNDYANSEEDFTDKMVVQKIKDIIKYHELDPQDLIDEIRIEFGVDAMD